MILTAEVVGLIVAAVFLALALLGQMQIRFLPIGPLPRWTRITFGVFAALFCVPFCLAVARGTDNGVNPPPNTAYASDPAFSAGPSPSSSPLPPPSPTATAAPLATATLTSPPDNSPFRLGNNVPVAGEVRGLPTGSTVWILPVSSTDPSIFYFMSDGPIATRDGAWKTADSMVGNETDRGFEISYVVFQADTECNDVLVAADKAGPITPPASCVELTRSTMQVS